MNENKLFDMATDFSLATIKELTAKNIDLVYLIEQHTNEDSLDGIKHSIALRVHARMSYQLIVAHADFLYTFYHEADVQDPELYDKLKKIRAKSTEHIAKLTEQLTALADKLQDDHPCDCGKCDA